MGLEQKLQQLIVRAYGAEEARRYANYRLHNVQIIGQTATDLMNLIEPREGACTLLSASWVAYLRDKYNIPAVAVAGDLWIDGAWIYRCGGTLPTATKRKASDGKPTVQHLRWNGHCWMEIDGLIADLSIFRTAYSRPPGSHLRTYIENTFGCGRGAFACPVLDLPQGMKYRRRFVLADEQINAQIAAQAYLLKNDN